MRSAHRQRDAVAQLSNAGARIEYDFQAQQQEQPPSWPAWLVDLLGIDCFAKVVSVDLGATQITDDALENIGCLDKIEELLLYDTKVTDAGIRQLTNLRSLRLLTLNNTLVTDAGLPFLKELRSLQQLHLHKTQITPAGAAKLRESLPDCVIWHARSIVENDLQISSQAYQRNQEPGH